MAVKLAVKRKDQTIERDISRVICRPYIPGGNPARIQRIFKRVTRLEHAETERLLEQTLQKFSHRHKDIKEIFIENFQQAIGYAQPENSLSLNRSQKLLLGAYFTKEYAIESAALFNPSIVPHPDQGELPNDSLRFIMSLRAVGEGHISTMVFRSGVIDKENYLQFDAISPYVDTPEVRLHSEYDRHLFRLKLHEMGTSNEVTNHVLEKLPEHFAFEQLQKQIVRLNENPEFEKDHQQHCFNDMRRLAISNYEIDFSSDHEVSERVIFPISEEERGGIEDARFVKFQREDGTSTYYALYTAFNGITAMPQLIETVDFVHFKINTLNGKAVQNKGMALFPRKIDGRYVMLSRQDGENNHIMFSKHLHFWQESQIIQEPNEPWEFIQIGNCGSPIETDRGWLVLTHGVGPVRTYSLGAILLDLDDPSKVIARLEDPLLQPQEEEREGYVPNVVYTCGAILHCGQLIIPYAMSDIQSAIASVGLTDLLDAMVTV